MTKLLLLYYYRLKKIQQPNIRPMLWINIDVAAPITGGAVYSMEQ